MLRPFRDFCPSSHRSLGLCLLVILVLGWARSVNGQSVQVGVRAELLQSKTARNGYVALITLKLNPAAWLAPTPGRDDELEAEAPEGSEDGASDAEPAAGLPLSLSNSSNLDGAASQSMTPSSTEELKLDPAEPRRVPLFVRAPPRPVSVEAEPGHVPVSGDADDVDWTSRASPDVVPAQLPQSPRTFSDSNAELYESLPAGVILSRARHQVSAEFVKTLLSEVRKRATEGQARLDSLASRSRSSALLPELRLMAGRSADQSLRYSPTTNDPNRWLQAGGADLRYQAQATWNLDKLVFSRQELGVERFRAQKEKEVEHTVQRALNALFAWQRAKVRALGLATEEQIAQSLLEAEQQRLLLDVLSGGWFSRTLARPDSAPGVEVR